MCGIIGSVGPWSVSDKDKQAIRNMFYLDVLRGRDSSGAVFFNSQNKKSNWCKRIGLPDAIEDMKEYQEAWKSPFTSFIGHNRFATMGKVNIDNAHPFEKGDVVGVHNGTLYKEDLVRLLSLVDRETSKGVTDSEIIFEVLEKHNIETLWKNICGPATLVWLNSKEESTNIVVHDKRPLYSWTAPSGRMFFASEPWMISIGVSRAGMHTDINPLLLEKDVHICITREQESFGMNQIRTIQKIRRTPLVPFVDLSKKKYSDYWDGRTYDHKGHNFPKGKEIACRPPRAAEKPKVVLPPQQDFDEGTLKKRADGTYITMNKLVKSLCSWCSSLLVAHKCFLYAEDLQLCDECEAVAHHTEAT